MPSTDECLQSVKDGLVDWISMLEMLYHDALQQLGCHSRIPNTFRIHDDDGTGGAYTETRRLATLHSLWPEEKIFALQKLGEQRVDLSSPAIGGAEIAGTHQYVARIGFHLRLHSFTHQAKILLAPRSPPGCRALA